MKVRRAHAAAIQLKKSVLPAAVRILARTASDYRSGVILADMKKIKSFLRLSRRDTTIVIVLATIGVMVGVTAVFVSGSDSRESNVPSDVPVIGGAMGALTRNTYDNTVRIDVNNAVAQISEDMANNRGRLPGSQSDIDDAFSTYDGDITVRYMSSFDAGSLPVNSKTYYYLPRYRCQGKTPVQSTNTRDFAVIGTLSSGDTYCVQL